jgi:2-enoate reductase
VPGSVPRMKYDVANYLRYLQHALDSHVTEYGLTVCYRTTATPKMLKAGGFDVVVTATGGEPTRPPVPGIDGANVVQAIDLLRQPSLAADTERIVVVGGGAVGSEVAYWLAYEMKRRITVVEMLPHFMKGICTANRGHLLHGLERVGVELLNCTRLKSIEVDSVTLTRNMSSTVPDPYCTWQPVLPENVKNPLARQIREEEREVTLPADLVVIATGLKPADTLYQACVLEHVAPEIHNIGDSFAPGRVFEAVKAGYAVGRLV